MCISCDTLPGVSPSNAAARERFACVFVFGCVAPNVTDSDMNDDGVTAAALSGSAWCADDTDDRNSVASDMRDSVCACAGADSVVTTVPVHDTRAS